MSVIPLSLVRTHGDIVYLSGTIGRAADGTIPADFAEQTHLAMKELVRLLEDAGASTATVLKATVFIVDPADFPAMNEIYLQYFSAPFPTRSTLVTGLALPELKFEIEAIAHLA